MCVDLFVRVAIVFLRLRRRDRFQQLDASMKFTSILPLPAGRHADERPEYPRGADEGHLPPLRDRPEHGRPGRHPEERIPLPVWQESDARPVHRSFKLRLWMARVEGKKLCSVAAVNAPAGLINGSLGNTKQIPAKLDYHRDFHLFCSDAMGKRVRARQIPADRHARPNAPNAGGQRIGGGREHSSAILARRSPIVVAGRAIPRARRSNGTNRRRAGRERGATPRRAPVRPAGRPGLRLRLRLRHPPLGAGIVETGRTRSGVRPRDRRCVNERMALVGRTLRGARVDTTVVHNGEWKLLALHMNILVFKMQQIY